MERRSARSDRVRKTYTNDAFEGIDELEDLRSDDGQTGVVLSDSDVDSQDRFEEQPQQSPDDDSSSPAGDDASESGSSADEEAEATLGEVLLPLADLDNRPLKRRKSKPGPEKKPPDASTLYVRGITERIEHKVSPAQHRLFHFGASERDHKAVEAARRKWSCDGTLPSRVTDVNGLGGMHSSFFLDEQEWASEADRQSEWWSEGGGRVLFSESGATEAIKESQAANYMPEKQSRGITFLMGPFNEPKLFELGVGQHLPILDAWRASDVADASTTPEDYKTGFVLNLGAKVQCVEWAPNLDRHDQYLAASVRPEQNSTRPPLRAPEAPAFTPQPPCKSNIQIWRFQNTEKDCVNTNIPPKLELVLCTDWGELKVLKWCPMPYTKVRYLDGRHVGLLAGIWSDGGVRILDVNLQEAESETQYVQIKRAAFESKPPATVCTCLTWISSTRIAAGCANGAIAIWDLPAALKSASPNPRPTTYSAISSTYILSITTCYPSRPNLLLVASMAGIITMTDLSRSRQSIVSQASTVPGVRTRMPLPLLVWHDFGQAAIHGEDNSSIKASTIRRFFANIALARGKSGATSIATSPCHPFLLVGCANGEVFSTNPLNRIADVGRSETWQQVWFAHEWRCPITNARIDDNDASGEMHIDQTTSAETGAAANSLGSMSKFTEGFKAEFVPLAGDSQKHNRHNGTAFTTVYEEKSAITAVAWNPNLHVGGWAAAGMGDGLLRVENLSI